MGFSDSLGGLGGIIGSAIGYGDTQDDRDRILKELQAAQGRANGLDTGALGQTAFSGLSTDPATRNAQMLALQRLGQISSDKGMDPVSQAQLASANREAAGFEQSQRGALQQNLQARGMGGSGAEIAGLLAAQQGGANRSAAGAQQAAADASARSLAALSSYGNLAGQVRGQDYGQAADRARAQDEATRAKFGGDVTKIGMQNQAGQGVSNYYGNDMATKMAMYSGAGRSLGGYFGGNMDAGAAMMGMAGGGGAGGGKALQSMGNYNWSSQSPDEWAPYPYSKKSIVPYGDK